MASEIPLDTTLYPERKVVRIKIDFTDQSGARYALNIQGISKDNITKVMDFVQSISPTNNTAESPNITNTNFAKVYELITHTFRFGSFTSTDVFEACRDELQLSTNLSVISIYLTRLTNRGFLTRTRHGSGWIYKLPRLEQTDQTSLLTNEYLAKS